MKLLRMNNCNANLLHTLNKYIYVLIDFRKHITQRHFIIPFLLNKQKFAMHQKVAILKPVQSVTYSSEVAFISYLSIGTR